MTAGRHTTAGTKEKIQNFGWELVHQPPHGPNFTPCDYLLLLHLKQWPGGQRFEDDEELKTTVVNWFNSQVANLLCRGIKGAGAALRKVVRTKIKTSIKTVTNEYIFFITKQSLLIDYA